MISTNILLPIKHLLTDAYKELYFPEDIPVPEEIYVPDDSPFTPVRVKPVKRYEKKRRQIQNLYTKKRTHSSEYDMLCDRDINRFDLHSKHVLYPLIIKENEQDPPEMKYAKFVLKYSEKDMHTLLCLCKKRPTFTGTPSQFLDRYRYVLHVQYMRERRLQYQFRRILNKWRISRIQLVSDTDPITLAPPTNVIEVYDAPNARKYIFDAQSLARHICASLKYHQYLIPYAQNAKNPLTNVQFTYAQYASIFMQLRMTRYMPWEFGLFYKLNFSIPRWRTYMRMYLTVNAAREEVQNIHSDDGKELVLDFIITMSEKIGYNRILLSIESNFRSALDIIPDYPLLKQLRALTIIKCEAEQFGNNVDVSLKKACRGLLTQKNVHKMIVAISKKKRDAAFWV